VKLLPSIVHVRVTPVRRRMPELWLPLFVIWPLVLVLLLPLLLLGLCVALVVEARSVVQWLALLWGVYTLLCELRGVRIDVRGPGSQVLVSIF
jgi:hypothetical protein